MKNNATGSRIEDPAPFTVEISRYQKYGELLKNSVENYPMRDRIVLVMFELNPNSAQFK